MRLAGIIENDIVDCDEGVCVSMWAVGCPHRCKGCHNQLYWDYNSGEEVEEDEVAEMVRDFWKECGAAASNCESWPGWD